MVVEMPASEWAGTAWAGDPIDLATRAIDSFTDMPGLTEQLLAAQGIRARPWLPLSIDQAISIPAQFRSVNLIAGLVGSLSMLCYRNGRVEMPTPKLVARPDPWQSARDFYGGTAWNLATRGEFIWYVANRTSYLEPAAVINLPIAEVMVEWADEFHWQRAYRWRNQELDPRRVVHVRKSLEPNALRGFGPLQRCGAAITAAAEADEYAATYFAEGAIFGVHLHSETPLDDAEAELVRQRWIARGRSSVRVTSGGVMASTDVGTSPSDSQLLESRLHSRGEAAVMWGIPAKLLEYAAEGASLTYQNVGDVMTEFVRQELAPGYLEPIEQAMSDLLSRARVARFDVSGLQRADPKTRWEIHKTAVEIGAYDGAYAALAEGIDPRAAAPDLEPMPALETGGRPGGSIPQP